MRHWSQLATRNWRVKRVRTAGAVLAIALGTAVVVWVTCCYESVRAQVTGWSRDYVGRSHLNVESPLGKYDTLPERIAENLREVPEVQHVTARLVQRLRVIPAPRAALATQPAFYKAWRDNLPEVDFHGIDLATEFEVRKYDVSQGHMLRESDEFACVLEESFAAEEGLKVGDFLMVWGGSRDEPYPVEIVGLMPRRRIARFQKGLSLIRLSMLQQINIKQNLVTSIDVILKDGTRAGVQAAAPKVRQTARRSVPNANVTSAEMRMAQIAKAQEQLQLVIVLLSCVAMLTALFIILSTLSMGMIERIAQLGLLRCIGVTGSQLGALILFEVLPLGVMGVLCGIPIGLGLAQLTVWLVPKYVGVFAVSWTGILLAVAAGLATTLVGALLPGLAAWRVSPLEAARPRARHPRLFWLVVVAVLAVGTLIFQNSLVQMMQRSPQFFQVAVTTRVLLYLGYALLAAPVVWLIGAPVVRGVARLIGVQNRLLQDQIGYAVWRSAGICCGLMVGLSLIVGLIVFNESVTGGWQFPKQFPEAYLWSFERMTPDAAKIIAETDDLRGRIRNFTTANAVNVLVEEKPPFMEAVWRSVTWFLGCEPDSFFDLLKLEFVEGDEATARAKLKEGGHVVVAEEFSRSRNKHVGDKVRVFLGDRWQTFTIAGVIESPAIDVAAGWFQAQSEMHVAAVGSVLGTNADLKRLFGVEGTSLVLLNFNLPPLPVPVGWPPAQGTPQAAGLGDAYYDKNVTLERRWQRQREEQVLHEITRRLNAAQAFSGTVRELKDEIDSELTKMTHLLTAVPTVALLIAAIGVANLMTANVTSRIKQLAVLRAVGATRGLVLRMVIGEALVLGALGSCLGVALGLHVAANTTTMTQRMWGFNITLQMPWGYVIGAVLLTIGLCILAGILPARYASKTNVVDALHVA